jgi:hypothetical protein
VKRHLDRVTRHLTSAALVLLLCAPAQAQNLEAKIQNLGNTVVGLLQAVALVMGIASTLVVGMKYTSGDHHAKEGVKGLIIGAFFSFSAVGIMQAMRTALS